MIRKIINNYIILNIIYLLKEDVAIYRRLNLIAKRKKGYIHLYVSGKRENITFEFKAFIFKEDAAIRYLINYDAIKQELIDKIDKKLKIEYSGYID